MVVSTSQLCEEMNLFRRHHTEPHQIKCHPVVSEEMLEQEQHSLEQQKQPEQPKEDFKELPKEQHKEQLESKEDVPKEESDKDLLLGMIFDLKDQISQLKNQLNNKNKQPEVAYFTLDEQGNIVPGVELSKLIGQETNSKIAKQEKLPEKEKKAQEQLQNRQAYHQKYIAV